MGRYKRGTYILKPRCVPTNVEILLKTVLDDPSDEVCRLVYADALEEAGKVAHAELVRAIAGYQWYAYQVVDPSYRKPASVFGKRCKYKAGKGFTFQWLLQVYQYNNVFTATCRQPWEWQLSREVVSYRYTCKPWVLTHGASPNKHNAMRRATRELFRHTNNECICRNFKLDNGFRAMLRGDE